MTRENLDLDQQDMACISLWNNPQRNATAQGNVPVSQATSFNICMCLEQNRQNSFTRFCPDMVCSRVAGCTQKEALSQNGVLKTAQFFLKGISRGLKHCCVHFCLRVWQDRFLPMCLVQIPPEMEDEWAYILKLCQVRDPEKRPPMADIVEMLNRILTELP